MIRKYFRRLFYFLCFCFLLAIGLGIFLHTSIGKSIVRDQLVSRLQKKLKSTVSIGSIDYSIPYWVSVKDIVILDRKNKSLLDGRHLYCELNMFKLFSGKINAENLFVKDFTFRFYRSEVDSPFNFQFIMDAFAHQMPAGKADTLKNVGKHSIKRISLNNIHVVITEGNSKKKKYSRIQRLICVPRDIDLQKMFFNLQNLHQDSSGVSCAQSYLNAPRL